MSNQKRSGKGGSPKKAIKRLRRKAVATLRQARLTAQLELVAAEAAAAQIREDAHAAAADEARLRDAAEQEMELKAKDVLDRANQEGREIVRRARTEADATREEADALAAAAKIAAEVQETAQRAKAEPPPEPPPEPAST